MTERDKLTPQLVKKYSEGIMPEDKDIFVATTEKTASLPKESTESEKKDKEKLDNKNKKKEKGLWKFIGKKEAENKELNASEKEDEKKEEQREKNKQREKETRRLTEEEEDEKKKVIDRAKKVLKVNSLTKKQEDALFEAHIVGRDVGAFKRTKKVGEKGYEEEEGTYTLGHIVRKFKILAEDNLFTRDQIQALMDEGVVGDEAPEEGSPQPDPPPGNIPSSEGPTLEDDLQRMLNAQDQRNQQPLDVASMSDEELFARVDFSEADFSGYPPDIQQQLKREYAINQIKDRQEQRGQAAQLTAETPRTVRVKIKLEEMQKQINSISTENTDGLRKLFADQGDFMNTLENEVFQLGRNERPFSDEDVADMRAALANRAKRVIKALDENDFNEAKKEAQRAIRYLRNRSGSVETRRIDVNSIEQLAELIIQTDPELWGERFPILDEEGNINQENFLNWIRERMLWHHDNDSDNPLQFMGLIEVSTPYQRINLNTMLSQRGKFFRTRDGVDLDELREQVTREVWLFNTSRNNDIEYRAIMHSGSDLNSKLKQMFYFNTFTKNAFGKSTLRWILTMPETFTATLEQKASSNEKVGQGDAKVGEGVRTAFLTYYHLSDLEKLREILGDEAPLLSREAYEEYIIEMETGAVKDKFQAQGKDVTEENDLKRLGMKTDTEYLKAKEERKKEVKKLIKEQSDTAESKAIQNKWLGSRENGNPYYLDNLFAKDGTIDKERFIDFINFFTGPETNSQSVATVREMVRKSLVKAYHKEGEPVSESIDEFFGMPQYAEQWAFSMLRWSGAAARNDTGARSYDKWTELQLTQFKRERDSSPARASGYGNPYNIGLYKALSPSLFNGIVLQDDKKTSPYELLESIEEKRRRGEEYNAHDELSRLEFTQNAMGQFAAVHLDNTFELLEVITGAKELDFDKFIQYDRYGRMVFQEAEFQEELKSFFKVWRNAYSTWGQINFAQEVRAMPERGSEDYVTVSLAEAMFGAEILDHPKFKTDGKFDPKKVNPNLETLWKQLVKGYIAAQIRAHRDLTSHYTRYDFGMIEGIYDTLKKVPGEVTLKENGEDIKIKDVRINYDEEKRAFNDEDIKWIRKHSGTEEKKMYAQALGGNAIEGTLKGGFNAIKTLVSEVFKQ